MSEEEIDKIVESIIKQRPINIFENISEDDFIKIQQKLIEKGWLE